MLLTSCAVGPDFLHPAAPEITRYTREPLVADILRRRADRPAQQFVKGRDIPQEWWGCSNRPRSTR